MDLYFTVDVTLVTAVQRLSKRHQSVSKSCSAITFIGTTIKLFFDATKVIEAINKPISTSQVYIEKEKCYVLCKSAQDDIMQPKK
jgi:hypothetical protein